MKIKSIISWIFLGVILTILGIMHIFHVTTITLGETGVDLQISNKKGIYLENSEYDIFSDVNVVEIGFNERYVLAVTDIPNVFGEEMIDYFYFDKEDPYNGRLELEVPEEEKGNEVIDMDKLEEEQFYQFAEEKGIELIDIDEFIKNNK